MHRISLDLKKVTHLSPSVRSLLLCHNQVGPGVKALADAKIAAAKLLTVIDRTPEIGGDDSEGGEGQEGEKPKKKRITRGDVEGEITMDNVHFRYRQALPQTKNDSKDGEDTVIDDEQAVSSIVFGGCNLTIEAGQTVALVGESGCGKSTIAKLVQRFYDPTEGRMMLDGTDLKDINVHELRSCIGVVSQEPLLFDTTIEANIRYGKPDATFEDIVKAAESANAHDFIMSFPDGYQTNVGSRGSKLSGGQKQRVAIARAMLRDPPILVRIFCVPESLFNVQCIHSSVCFCQLDSGRSHKWYGLFAFLSPCLALDVLTCRFTFLN